LLYNKRPKTNQLGAIQFFLLPTQILIEHDGRK
jgi:hypothetical protein